MHQIKYQPEGSFEDQVVADGWMDMPLADVNALEQELELEPDNVSSRHRLLSYFCRRQNKGRPAPTASFFRHLIWFIDNHPRHCLHAFVFVRNDDARFLKARLRWLRQVRNNPDDVTILYHAAMFCVMWRKDDAVKFFERAAILDPYNEEIPRHLASLYNDLVAESSPRKRTILLRNAVAQIKTAVELYTLCLVEFSYLEHSFDYAVIAIAENALSLGSFQEAGELADILLDRKAIEDRRNSSCTDATRHNQFRVLCSINFGHAMHGRLALSKGDIAVAKEHLVHMTNQPVCWNPDWKLANLLLRKGDATIVARYVEHIRENHERFNNTLAKELSRGYWTGNKRTPEDWDIQLRTWLKDIERGKKVKIGWE